MITIEDLKEHCERQLEILPKRSKMHEEHLLTLDIINKSKYKDKQIDLIYDFLYMFGCERSGSFMKALGLNGFDLNKCDNCEYKTYDCKNCIKQYFNKKVLQKKQNTYLAGAIWRRWDSNPHGFIQSLYLANRGVYQFHHASE